MTGGTVGLRIADLLLPEFDNEVRVTRRVLERVPDDRAQWKPHPKAFPMGHLAQLVARLPGWIAMAMDRTELDMAPKSGPAFPGYSFEKTETLLAEFDRNVELGRRALAEATDDDFHVAWSLKRAGMTITTMSRYECVRSMGLNHLVHHRAQLAFYLRLSDLPVPMMYGPTADESP